MLTGYKGSLASTLLALEGEPLQIQIIFLFNIRSERSVDRDRAEHHFNGQG